MTAIVPGPTDTRSALAILRPQLLDRFDAALPGARAAVLARLWGAFAREDLSVAARHRTDDTLTVTLTGGRRLSGPARAAQPYADPAAGLRIDLDGRAFTDPAVLLRAVAAGPHAARLAVELDNSVANLALGRAARGGIAGPVLARLAALPPPRALAEAEQFVVDGHPLHPCCRTRAGMAVADVLAYAPEHQPVVTVPVLRVPTERWHGSGPPLLPVHPWQAARLRQVYPWLRPHGAFDARPLMSLRTVAPVDGGDHVKTAVDVQMTSAVRTVSPAAVHNGPLLSALLERLTADLPSFAVLAETAAGAATDAGEPLRALAYVRRRAPRPAAGEVVVPVAALAAHPGLLDEVVAAYGGDPCAWLAGFAAVFAAPLLTILHRGVALEAHGQNTLVVLRGGRCTRVLYRDFGGVRVDAARVRAAGAHVPQLCGDVPADDPGALRTKVAAAAFAGVAAEQVAVLSRRYGVEPQLLWAVWARAVAGCGTADARALLADPTLPVKATTAMRLADDPLADIWAYVDNPMAGLA